jgi:hypothetical protein
MVKLMVKFSGFSTQNKASGQKRLPGVASIQFPKHGTVFQVGNLPLGHGFELRRSVFFDILNGCQAVLWKRVMAVEQFEGQVVAGLGGRGTLAELGGIGRFMYGQLVRGGENRYTAFISGPSTCQA